MTPHPALRHVPGPADLCQPVADWRGKMPGEHVIVDTKVDGVRAWWTPIHGLLTQNGHRIRGLEIGEEAMRSLASRYSRPMMFDSELRIGDCFEATARHVAFTKNAPTVTNAVLTVFDAVDLAAWHGDRASAPLIDRINELDDKIATAGEPALARSVSVAFDNPADILAYANDRIAAGDEGIVAKDAYGQYRRDRRNPWLRIKGRKTFDLRILGVVPDPDSRFRIAALAVDFNGTKLRIANGFSDAERKMLWEDRALINGRFVEVSAKDRTIKGKLREPVFERIRWERIWHSGS